MTDPEPTKAKPQPEQGPPLWRCKSCGWQWRSYEWTLCSKGCGGEAERVAETP